MGIRFSDVSGATYTVNPIVPARSVEPIYKSKQVEKYGSDLFAGCPGIFDYKNVGWIMPAWDDIRVYSSDNATMAYAGSQKRPPQWKIPQKVDNYKPTFNAGPMDKRMVDGVPAGNACPVKSLQPLHFSSPWVCEMFGDEYCSLLLMPPFYHSDIVDKVQVFPGIVDYTKVFDTMSIVLAPRTTGTFTIKAGTPLVHIIPLEKKTYKATYGPAKMNRMKGFKASCEQFYRKYIMKRSRFEVKLDDLPKGADDRV